MLGTAVGITAQTGVHHERTSEKRCLLFVAVLALVVPSRLPFGYDGGVRLVRGLAAVPRAPPRPALGQQTTHKRQMATNAHRRLEFPRS